MVMALSLDGRTNRSTKKPAYTCSDTFSKKSMSICATPRRRYWGATVTAVTWPCSVGGSPGRGRRALPSALPSTYPMSVSVCAAQAVSIMSGHCAR